MPSLEPRILNTAPTIITDFHSTIVGQNYRLFIAPPRENKASGKTYPVLYILDPQGIFLLVRQISELLQIQERIPDLLLVGVGYPLETHMDTLTIRSRDLTFDVITVFREETGGGGRFLECLQTELIPMIEATYPVHPNQRGLMGWSMAANFTIEAALREPALFQAAAAIGPYLDDTDISIPAAEARFAQSHTALPLRLFVATETIPLSPGRPMTQPFRDLVANMRARHYADLSLFDRIYEDEDHFSVVPLAITHALCALYGTNETGQVAGR